MGSLNKAQLIGNISSDIDSRATPQGKSVVNFSMATNEKYNGEDKPQFHRIVMWNKLAEIATQYLKKGSLIYIEGKLQTRKWEKDGHTNYTTEIVAFNMTMLGGKGESNQTPKPPQDIPSTDFEEDSLPF